MEKYFGEWTPYSGNGSIILGVVLLLIAIAFIVLGSKLERSLTVRTPGKATGGIMIIVWILSILTFFVNLGVYSLYILYSLAGMFLAFAIWAFLSFSFAYTTTFLVLNVAAKAMAFVTIMTLFLPERNLDLMLQPQVRKRAV